MGKPVFKRKIYNEILDWKEHKGDKYALLIKGARRVGKSTIAEEFARNEFKSYILIDFANTIPGLDLELKKNSYVRENVIPVFISEHAPARNRENSQRLFR